MLTATAVIDWEVVARRRMHKLAVRILEYLADVDEASPSDMARRFNEPGSNVAYHVRALSELGCVELVRTEPRRGALEHFYRLAEAVRS